MATGQDGLTQSERRELESLASRRKTALGLAQWARIVLHAAEGAKNKDIGLRGGRCGWRGLYDEPRPDAPRQIDDDVAEVVRETLETTPRDARQGSLCSMAKAAGFARIDEFIGSGRPSIFSPITPRRSSFRQLPICREGARYCRPSPVAAQRALILCVAEKSQIEGWIDPSRCFPCARDKSSGAPTTIRHGAFLFTAPRPARSSSGRYPRHRGREFLRFLREIERHVPH